MLLMAWPDWMRRAHTSYEFGNSPSSCTFGWRMFWLPSAWQDCLTVSIQACWLRMKVGTPLPPGPSPVPGNWSAAGMRSMEYQYMPG